jgi:patatin-related protein
MSNQRRYYQPKFSSEIRLGLVVYGGISLAIYVHGICQEFYHAVRGRGIYKLVKALVDADVVVDAISGSSAAGVNGVLLSYALTNSNEREVVDFSSFASIWRNSGELLNILYHPSLFKGRINQAQASSSDLDRSELSDLLAKSSAHKLPRSPHEWFSTTQELDLFIAGTNYLGRVERRSDETGVWAESRDHHALFHLKHRQGRKEPFNPHYRDPILPRTAADTENALAKLCRITAGFPAVFPLVEVDLQNHQNSVDRQLAVWGKLDRQCSADLSSERDGKLYFLDGGLVDNAPFTCIMKETYYRLPTSISRRKLFYVDPSISQVIDLVRQTRRDAAQRPRQRLNLTRRKISRTEQSLQAAVFSIPSHQSITNDLRAIQEHNHKVRRYKTSIELATAAVDSQRLLADEDRTQSQIYLRSRLFDFRDRNLPLLLRSEPNSHNSYSTSVFDKIDRIMSSKPTNSKEQKHHHNILNRFESQTIDLDVEYSIRKHFYLRDRVNDSIVATSDPEAKQHLQYLSQQLSCNIKLLEVVRASVDLLLRDRTVSNYFQYLIDREFNERRLHALVYELIFRLHRFLLDGTRLNAFIPEDLSTLRLETIPAYFWLDLPELAAQTTSDRWLSQTRISSVFAQLKQRIADLQQSTDLHKLIWMDRQLEYDNNHNHSFPSILKQIDLAAVVAIERWQISAKESATESTPNLLQQWHTFSCLDRELYPFEYLTDLSEKELIQPIDISPEVAQLGLGKGKNTQDKLAGTKLYNIGGFFKKSWKSNDLIWGRLDGLNRIVEGTITPESVTAFAGFVEREINIANCSREHYLDWLITESIPQISAQERQSIARQLERLAQPNLRIDRAELRQILADLVLVGQREILNSEPHTIVEDIDEQPGWWRAGATDRATTESWLLNKIGLQSPSLPVLNAKKIGRIVQKSLSNLADRQKNFFHHQYRIGVDKLWENMPLVTLINFCTQIVLILRNLLVSFGGISPQNSVLPSPLYHWLDGSLQSLYWWLQGGSIRLGAAHRRPRIIMFQLLGAATAICGIALAFVLSPLWLVVSLPGAAICWFLQTMRLKRFTGVQSSPFLTQGRDE